MSTLIGDVLGDYTPAVSAAATGGLTRLLLDVGGGALLYRVNKDIHRRANHFRGKFSTDFLHFSLLTRGLEAATSVMTMHYLMHHTNVSDIWAIATNGKIFFPLFLIGEPMIYSRMVLHENPLPKTWASINNAAKATVNAVVNAKKVALTLAYTAATDMTRYIM